MGILDPNKLQVLRRLADMPQNLCNDTHFNNTLNQNTPQILII
jgi:hypothetical protein